MDILRSVKFFLLGISLMDVEAHCLSHSTGRKPHTLNRMTSKKLLSFLTPFSDLFLLEVELHCVNIKDFMVLFKREPALYSLTALCIASGIKDSRNWPLHWWEFSFLCPSQFMCHAVGGFPRSLQSNPILCVLHLQLSQHFGFIHRHLIRITLYLILN